ncbi:MULTISPECIES: cobalamin B12-binding domain-containing protein [unclassified Nocardioides]|uniref:cobalamin B12-binding domain-containing protein n=1 Tax=unclassified Nocardioides TaxID=2615069 RepID=UPI0006F867BF|nr:MULTISPECIES: cobalamin B12-binding domain-containing protein [unclassified Nocardioides]KRA31113.1 methylmalonyl-CoA mutase [Nocardioides sp. Root614]KRA87733.1 methylmalonyl-CoA mutase [Nocardioides sp. Root682]
MAARILVAKPGLDGHDRGAKLVAVALRDAGFEVIYTGIRQLPVDIATIAVQENVDMVGLSILSGAHMALVRKTIIALEEAGGGDIPVVVGGTIPSFDVEPLQELGVRATFPTGSSLTDLVAGVHKVLDQHAAETEGTSWTS